VDDFVAQRSFEDAPFAQHAWWQQVNLAIDDRRRREPGLARRAFVALRRGMKTEHHARCRHPQRSREICSYSNRHVRNPSAVRLVGGGQRKP